MIVVRSRNKNEYLEALHQTDMLVGTAPSDGAAATISQIEPFLKYFKELVKRELQYNISFVEKSGENIWWYDGQQLEFRSPNVPKLLLILQQNPSITYAELSKELGINTSAVQKLLTGLKEKGYIQRRNHEKMWYVSAVSSLLKA